MAITIDLSGKVALVTGGSRGLGAAMARRLAAASGCSSAPPGEGSRLRSR